MASRAAIDWEQESYDRGLRGQTVEFICCVGGLLTEEQPFPTAAIMDEAARTLLADDARDTIPE